MSYQRLWNRVGPPVASGDDRYAGETKRWSSSYVSPTGRVGTGFGSTVRGGARTRGGGHSKDLQGSLNMLASVSNETAKAAVDILSSVLSTNIHGQNNGSEPHQGLNQQGQRGNHPDFSRERRYSPPHHQHNSAHLSTSHERHYNPGPSFSPLHESQYSPHRSISPLRNSRDRPHRSVSPRREYRFSHRRSVSPTDEFSYSHYRTNSLQKSLHSSLREQGYNPVCEDLSTSHRGRPNSPHRSNSPFHEHRFKFHEGRNSPNHGRPISPSHARIQSNFERPSHNTDQYEGFGSRDLRVSKLKRTQSEPKPPLNTFNTNHVPPQRANPATMGVGGTGPTGNQMAGSTSHQMGAAQGMVPRIETLFITHIKLLMDQGVIDITTPSQMRTIVAAATPKEKLKFLVKVTFTSPGNLKVKHSILPLIQDGFWSPKGKDYFITWQPSGATGVRNQDMQKQPGPADSESGITSTIPADFFVTKINFLRHGKLTLIEDGNHLLRLMAEGPREEVLIRLIRARMPPGRPFLRKNVLPLLQDGTWTPEGKDYIVTWKPYGQPSGQGETGDVTQDTQKKPDATPGKMPPIDDIHVSKLRVMLKRGTMLIRSPTHLERVLTETPKEKLRIIVQISDSGPGKIVVKRMLSSLSDGIWMPSRKNYIVTWKKDDVQHSGTGQGETAVVTQSVQQTTNDQREKSPIRPSLKLKCHMCSSTMTSEKKYRSHILSNRHRGVADAYCNKVNTTLSLHRAESKLATIRKMTARTKTTRCITCEVDIPSEIEGRKAHYKSLEHKLVEKFQNVLCCGIMFTNRLKFEFHCLTIQHLKKQMKKQKETKTPKKVDGVTENDEKVFEDIVSELQNLSETPTNLESLAVYDPTKPHGVNFLSKEIQCQYSCKLCPEVAITTTEMIMQHFHSYTHYKCFLEHFQKQEEKKGKEDNVKRKAKEDDKKRKAEEDVKKKTVKDKQEDGGENPKKKQKVEKGEKEREEVKTYKLKRSWEDERKKPWLDEDELDYDEEDMEDQGDDEREEEKGNEEEEEDQDQGNEEREEEEGNEESEEEEDTEDMKSVNEASDGEEMKGDQEEQEAEAEEKKGDIKQEEEDEEKGDEEEEEARDNQVKGGEDKDEEIDESDEEFLDYDDEDPTLLLEEIGGDADL